jgi:hypothetical protein
VWRVQQKFGRAEVAGGCAGCSLCGCKMKNGGLLGAASDHRNGPLYATDVSQTKGQTLSAQGVTPSEHRQTTRQPEHLART